MIINNAQIAVSVLSAAQPAAAQGAASQALDIAAGGKTPANAKSDDAFAVKTQASLQDREIRNRMAIDEAQAKLDDAMAKLDTAERVNANEIIAPALALESLAQEKDILSDAVEKRLDALADRAAQNVELQGRAAVADALEDQDAPVEGAASTAGDEIDEAASDVEETVAEQTDAEASQDAGEAIEAPSA